MRASSSSVLGALENGFERYLCFSLAAEEYAIPLLGVREVIAYPEITPVPQTPSYFLGIMNLRGKIVSVVDLRMKLGLDADQSDETCVVICDFPGISLGVVVSSVNTVLALTTEQIGSKPELTGTGLGEFVRGIIKREEKLILLIELASVLGIDLQKLTAAATAA